MWLSRASLVSTAPVAMGLRSMVVDKFLWGLHYLSVLFDCFMRLLGPLLICLATGRSAASGVA